MALQLGALRDVLIDAGAKPEIAGKAAEELAAYDDKFVSLERTMVDKFAEAERSTADRLAEAERSTTDRFAVAERSTAERFAEAERSTADRFAESARLTSERLAAMDTRRARFEERVDGRFVQSDEKFQRVYWMLSVVIVLLVGLLGRLLFIH